MSTVYPEWSPLIYAMFVLGSVTALAIALFLLFGFLSAAPRWVAGWFTKPAPKDVPDFVLCTCAIHSMDSQGNVTTYTNPKCPRHGLNTNTNHTGTLSFTEMSHVPRRSEADVMAMYDEAERILKEQAE